MTRKPILNLHYPSNLTRCLLAAGGFQENEGTYLLYTEDSNLISKHWNGLSFDSQELIATSILPHSSAAYLTTPTGKLAIGISPSYDLRALIYDSDGDEWIDEESLGSHKLHPAGKLAALITEEGKQHIFFQDASKRLIHLDDEWKPTILPANPAEGSPLATSDADGKTNIFYISATDNYLHYATLQQNGIWSDAIFNEYAFGAKEKLKHFLISLHPDTGDFQALALTEQGALLQILTDGTKTPLGTADEAGNWIPATKEEASITLYPRGGRHKKIRIRF